MIGLQYQLDYTVLVVAATSYALGNTSTACRQNDIPITRLRNPERAEPHLWGTCYTMTATAVKQVASWGDGRWHRIRQKVLLKHGRVFLATARSVTEILLGKRKEKELSCIALIAEEAGQMSQYDLLGPSSMTTLKAFVCVGDHAQLPPVRGTYNTQAGLGCSLLELLA